MIAACDSIARAFLTLYASRDNDICWLLWLARDEAVRIARHELWRVYYFSDDTGIKFMLDAILQCN